MTNLQKAAEQGNQAAPNIIDAAKAGEVQIDVTLAQEQGNQATPLIADSLASSESYDAIKQQGNQAMPLIVDALIQPAPPIPTSNYLYFEAAEANSTLKLTCMRMSGMQEANYEISTDGINFSEWESETVSSESGTAYVFNEISFSAIGDKVYLRGVNPAGLIGQFSGTGKFRCGGLLTSLIGYDTPITSIPQYGFFAAFARMDSMGLGETNFPYLLTTPDLSNIETLVDGSMYNIFAGQSLLTTPADMPALTTAVNTSDGVIGSLDGAYTACYSLTRAAEMPNISPSNIASLYGCYTACVFPMSSDGETLNFSLSDYTFTQEEAVSVCQMLGNMCGLNGYVGLALALNEDPDVRVYVDGQSSIPFPLSFAGVGYDASFVWWEKYPDETPISIDGVVYYSPDEEPEYQFVKWQEYLSGEWTDLSTENPYSLNYSYSGQVRYIRFIYEHV